MSGVHDWHEAHPRYSPAQVLKDGCEECSRRSRDIAVALNHMDPATFARAWKRAGDRSRSGLRDMSDAEAPLLEALAAVQQQMARNSSVFLAAALNPA